MKTKTAILKALLLVPFVCLACFPSLSFANQASNTANEVSARGAEKFSSPGGLQSNIFNPLMNRNTPLYTIDGTKSGNVQMLCPSSNKFLEIMIQPGNTGDINSVLIRQDTNFDGNADYSYGVPVLVSGVCSNGIISCTAGSWINCSQYRWTADTNGRVSLSLTSLTDLGGCYCINNSCGSGLAWSNLSTILRDIGGGVVGAVQAANKRYAISNIEAHGTVIQYYGQDMDKCSTGSASHGRQSLEQYYSNPAQLKADVQTKTISQSTDPLSYYSILSSAFTNLQTNARQVDCNISRVVSVKYIGVEDIIGSVGGNGGGVYSRCGPKCVYIASGIVGDNYWCASCGLYETYWDVIIKLPEFIDKVTLTRVKWDDWIKVILNDRAVYYGPREWRFRPRPCELATSWNVYPNLDVTAHFKDRNLLGPGGRLRLKNQVAVAGCGEGYAIMKVELTTSCDVNSSISNLCSRFENDRKCKIKDEIVDGVYTYRNFNPTGLIPINSCKRFSCGEESTEVCHDWWEKKRTYVCEETPIDFTGAKRRLEVIQETVTDNTTSLYYRDLRKTEGGTWVTEDKTIGLSERQAYDSCEKTCKVRKPKTDTKVAIAGHAKQYQTDIQAYDFFYRPCSKGTCPIGDGEEIVKNCQCINEFAEAAAVIQMLRMAGQDIICSDGTPKGF